MAKKLDVEIVRPRTGGQLSSAILRRTPVSGQARVADQNLGRDVGGSGAFPTIPQNLDVSAPQRVSRRVGDLTKSGVTPVDSGRSEAQAAGATIGAAAISAGFGTVAHFDDVRFEERIAKDNLLRNFANAEFVRELQEAENNRQSIERSLSIIDDIQRQSGSALAGQQRQLFLRDPETGRRI